ncbi:MerR family transcriptional regulator [Longispora fulva]|uniref:Molybdopterin-binding protein n=1 Tax=Longispora fulva TaxID=619741 RepID=A0A8J7GAG3_9ACTN|nr:helix-turn-helix transcriptional regulator [Longispora fulva]MBG6136773.1 molybdopterin-binding protein [Longispora fulva]GIG59944.1 MerR family transcriptional regulator [Longispora fulva]
MVAFRMGEVAGLLGVSVDTVRRWADGGRLPVSRDDHGHRVVEGGALAGFLRTHSAEADKGSGSSARNRLPGIVTEVIRDGVMAQVEIHAGGHRIVSLMSREAADELGLQVGVPATAVVKSTNVVVEVPQRGAKGQERS